MVKNKTNKTEKINIIGFYSCIYISLPAVDDFLTPNTGCSLFYVSQRINLLQGFFLNVGIVWKVCFSLISELCSDLGIYWFKKKPNRLRMLFVIKLFLKLYHNPLYWGKMLQ